MNQPNHTVRDYALLVIMPLLFSSNLVLGRAVAGTVEP